MTDLPEEVMLRLPANLYDAFWKRNSKAGPVTPFSDQSDAIKSMWQSIAKDAISALTAEGYMVVKGWRPIEEAPDRPMPVIFWFGNRRFDQSFGAIRDFVESCELGWWDGKRWREAGTGHDMFEPHVEADDFCHATHYAPLLPAPEEE